MTHNIRRATIGVLLAVLSTTGGVLVSRCRALRAAQGASCSARSALHRCLLRTTCSTHRSSPTPLLGITARQELKPRPGLLLQ